MYVHQKVLSEFQDSVQTPSMSFVKAICVKLCWDLTTIVLLTVPRNESYLEPLH